MNETGYLLVGLTAIVAALVAVLVYAAVRFAVAARDAGRRLRGEGSETAFMAAAVEQAVGRLREQERAMKVRAEESERLSGGIIASMTSGLLIVGPAGEVRTLNPAGRRLLGLSGPEPEGSIGEVLAGARPLADAVRECLAAGQPIVRRTLEMTPADADGARHLGVTVSPVAGAEHRSGGAICLFTDLSDVVELEEQLRLKDSLARLGELTAGLAHEFRNGLATIHGYSRLLPLEKLPADYRPYVEGIRQETDALGKVVNNFLNYARPAEPAEAPVDLGALVERVAEEIRGEVEARGGAVRVGGTFATVNGDDVMLRQAFANLCRNAFEACAEAGIMSDITLDGVVDRTQGVVRVTVQDNGPGLDRAAGDRIFRPFFTTRPGGTGLGLAVVQKVVVSHNGRVSAGPAPGGGASFQVVLPLP